MTSAERPEADLLEQQLPIDEADETIATSDTEANPETDTEADPADAAEQRRPAGTAGDDEDYPPG
ncbi:hypothetical protein [Pseudonocardia acaciae]|uniref:hypothetical protein n=1 Tax=Pseudonocardia acaciae TaxID=551276 RepID=UPI00056951B6|nr:hypothetical protein [Pseudonocardia acaciae]